MVEHGGRRELDHMMVGATVPGHERAEGKFVGMFGAERDRVGRHQAGVEPTGERDDEAGVEAA